MTKRFYTLMMALLLMILAGCGAKLPWTIMEDSDVNIYTDDDIKLSIKKGSLSNLGCIYLIENCSGSDILSNEVYALQLWKNNKWNKIDVESAFPAIEASISIGSTCEKSISWEYMYGKIPAGKYRLLVSVQPDGGIHSTEYFVSAEFRI